MSMKYLKAKKIQKKEIRKKLMKIRWQTIDAFSSNFEVA